MLKAYPALRFLLFFLPGICLADFMGSIAYVALGILLVLTLFIPSSKSFIWLAVFFFGASVATFQKPPLVPLNQVEAYAVYLTELPEDKPKTWKCKVEISAIKKDGVWKNTKGKTLIYLSKEAQFKPEFGQKILILKPAREIEGPKNPKEFDYKKFMAQKGIFFHQFLRSEDFILQDKKSLGFWKSIPLNLRTYSEKILEKYVSEPTNLSVAKAMLLGMKSDLDTEIRESYAAAGAVHILAVSGLHVGILFILLRMSLVQLIRHKWLLTFCIIACLALYALFTGLSPSVSRATLMFSLFQIGTLLNRDKNGMNIIGVSAILLLSLNPSWVYDVGFQLSYLAMFGILGLYPFLERLWKPNNKLVKILWQLSVVSICAQLLTFPLSIYYFQQFPNFFLLSNPVVTLFSSGILYSGIAFLALAKIPFFGSFLSKILDFFISWLNKFVLFMEELPHAVSTGFSWDVMDLCLWYAFILFILFFLIQKHPMFLRLGVLVSSLLLLNFSYKWVKTKNKEEIVFHYIPKSGGISYLKNQGVTFISLAPNLEDPRLYNFHLKNYYNHKMVKKFETKDIHGNTEIKLGDKKVLWIQSKLGALVNVRSDFVLISNNAVTSLPHQNKQTVFILDDSNSYFYTNKLRQEAIEKDLNLVVLYQHGAFTATF